MGTYRKGFIVAASAAACLMAGAEDNAAPLFTVPESLHSTKDLASIQNFASKAEGQGSYDLAAEALRRAVELRPEEGGLAARLIENLYRTGESGKAEALERADALLAQAAIQPDTRARALMIRGLIHFEHDMTDAAATDVDTLLALESGNVRAAILKGAIELAQGNVLPASDRIEALGAAAQPFDVETRYLMRWALRDFERDQRRFDDVPANHAAFGKLLYRAGRVPDALAALRKAASTGSDVKSWNLIAAICAQLGDARGVQTACEASLAINPDQPEIKQLAAQASAPPAPLKPGAAQ